MSTQQFDAIILGQGLAGTALAWTLCWAGWRVLVIDRDIPGTASKIAAGLMTPVTGQKLVPTWRFSELWLAARKFYERVERETQQQFFRQVRMIRLLANESEVQSFARRLEIGDFRDLIASSNPVLNSEWFMHNHGGFEMSVGGQLDVARYLQASRQWFHSTGSYESLDLDVSREIELRPDGVCIPVLGVTANWIFFCQGIDSRQNPWFKDVAFKPAKGEILTLHIPGLQEERVFHHGVWLAPIGHRMFKTGSTYEWQQLDDVPTKQARDKILSHLQQFLRLPFEIVSQAAAVRPIHRNQFPVVGLHPLHQRLGILNGLGSKGSLQAPWLAQHFADILLRGSSLDVKLDLNRKTQWTSPSGSPSLPIGNRNIAIPLHVERPTKRPLTEQAQNAIRQIIRPGETAIDATAGNGHDTHFLAQAVGTTGSVYAFDIQQVALAKTEKRLADAGIANVILLNEDHAKMLPHLPTSIQGKVAAVMFNLGYLPGGDKNLITRTASSLLGISTATTILRPGGLLTIVAYKGHTGGNDEAAAVESFLQLLPESQFQVTSVESQTGKDDAPVLFLVKRLLACID